MTGTAGGGAEPDAPDLDVADLFTRHTAGLLRYLSRRVSPAVAEDLVSQVFEIVVAAPGRYEPGRGTPKSWLYGIATHTLLAHFRATGRAWTATARLGVASADVTDPAGDVVERIDAEQRVEHLAAAIDDLAPDDREALLLTAWTDLSATEIGAVLGIPPGTVRSRLHRARTQLRSVDLQGTAHDH